MRRGKADFSDAVIDLIFERAQSRCELCGVGIHRHEGRGYWWSVHHREPKGMGGAARSPYLGLASNGLLLCGSGTTGCHGWVEAHRDDALALGLLVLRNGALRPEEVPVHTYLRGKVLHDAYGAARPALVEI